MDSSSLKHYSEYSSGLSRQERLLLDHFQATERVAVSAADVEAAIGVRRPHASRILSRLHRKGWLVRLKRGLYSVVPLGSPTPQASVHDGWAVAMELFSPCMISGWSAAEHWDLTEQIFNAVSVITTRAQPSRTRRAGGLEFVCRTLGEPRFFGAVELWSGSARIHVADPHRTIIDVLDAPEFGGGARHTLDVAREYWRGPHADPERVLEYGIRFGRGAVLKRLGFTAETWGNPSDAWLADCRARLSEGVSHLDPGGPKRGRIVSRWRLRINVPVSSE